MIHELLYTSHEGQGLRKGGGGGFCTVLSSEGMAPNVATALERLSGYKHPFDIHDSRAVDNPVNYRHAILRIGGVTYHVLSRIADLRHEHTGRSNKLAHHVAIPKDELPPGGPSWLLSSTGFCRADWDGEVRLVHAKSLMDLPQNDMPVGPCSQWKLASGDAGWAGSVAHHLLNAKNAPISVIYPQNTNTLSMANEVFSLLPPSARWQVTFSTYFTSLPAGTTCMLRFYLAGTTEAENLRRDFREKVIDLESNLGSPEENELVQAARSGRLQHPKPTPAVPQRSRRTPMIPVPTAAEADFDLNGIDLASLGTKTGQTFKAPEADPSTHKVSREAESAAAAAAPAVAPAPGTSAVASSAAASSAAASTPPTAITPSASAPAAPADGEEEEKGDPRIKDKFFWESLRGFLSPVWKYVEDEAVSEILINGPAEIFIERKGRLVRAPEVFGNEMLKAAVQNIAQYVGRRLSEDEPYMDARLPDGS
ncbi:MAG: hypothetical protein ABI614_10395, partial [Planctomycetota bacterium]